MNFNNLCFFLKNIKKDTGIFNATKLKVEIKVCLVTSMMNSAECLMHKFISLTCIIVHIQCTLIFRDGCGHVDLTSIFYIKLP